MKHIIKQFIKLTLSVGLLALPACDYLDVMPPAQPDFDDTMKDEASTLAFLHTAYSGTTNNFWRESPEVSNSTDEFLQPKDWGWDSQQMLFGTVSSADDIGNWETMYNYIGYVHYFMEQLELLNPAGVTEEDKQQYRAESWFLEAWYHFRVLQNYGPCPIIESKVDQNILPTDIPGRSHFDYCVDWIVAKLDAAAAVLPQKQETENLSRADATICKSLKARVLLYAASPLWNGSFVNRNWQNVNYETPGYGNELVSAQYDASKWERALTACREALTAAESAGLQLFDIEAANLKASRDGTPLPFIPGRESDTEENREFKERVRMLQYMMTAHEGDNNREIIWAINNTSENQMSHGAMKAHMPNRIVRLSNGSWGTGGYHGFAPTLNAAERFYTVNGATPELDDSFYDESEWFTRYYEGTSSPALTTDRLDGEGVKNDIAKFNVGREPRYYAWIAFDGCEYMPIISNNSPLWLNLKNSNTNGHQAGLRNSSGTGFLNKKFVVPNAVFSSSNAITGDRYRLTMIRMAELYLNLAECYAALDRTSEALEQLNIIRRRAGIRDLTQADLTDMSLMEWVRNERFVELFAEGHRYYDVRRWVIASEVMQPTAFRGLNGLTINPSFEDFNQVVRMDQPIQWNDRQYLIPIKSSELYSDPQLIQAPGY